MTIEQQNTLYYESERIRFRKIDCVRCRRVCRLSDEEVDECIQKKADKFFAEMAYPIEE